MIRREGVPKSADFEFDPNDLDKVFREATWEEALAKACEGFTGIRDSLGPNALAGFGSAKGSNEEAYLFQKLIRTGFKTNNVDHCARLCHAGSVTGLQGHPTLIDYASTKGAIGASGATASRAVFFSGLTVVLALLGMFIMPTTIFLILAVATGIGAGYYFGRS